MLPPAHRRARRLKRNALLRCHPACSPILPTCIALQVYESIKRSGKLSPQQLSYYDVDGATLLNELRLLSIAQRAQAAAYIADQQLSTQVGQASQPARLAAAAVCRAVPWPLSQVPDALRRRVPPSAAHRRPRLWRVP